MKNRKRLISGALALAMAFSAMPAAGAFAAAEQAFPATAISADAAATKDISKATVKLKYQSYTYTGSKITPDNRNGADEITVTLSGKTLSKGKDYTLKYKNNTKVGTASVTVTGKGKYSGSVTKSFVIKPAKNAITSITADTKSGGRFTICWGKATAGSVGYQVLYSKDKSALDAALNEVPNKSRDHAVFSWTQTDLGDRAEYFSRIPQKGETWYVKIRSFYTKTGNKNSSRYGTYSAVKSVYIPKSRTEEGISLYCPYITQYKTAKRSDGTYPYNSEGFSAKMGCGPTALTMLLQGDKGRTDLTKTRVITDQFAHGWFYNGWAGASASLADYYGCNLLNLINLAKFYGYTPKVNYAVNYSTVNGVTTIPDIDKCLYGGHLVLIGTAGDKDGKPDDQHFQVIYGRKYDPAKKENIYLIANPAHYDVHSKEYKIQNYREWGAKLIINNMNLAYYRSVRGILWLS